MKKSLLLFVCITLIIITSVTVFSHSGGTDGKGGHRGPDGYHYHHGHSEHQHDDLDGDGIADCPYDFCDNVDHQSEELHYSSHKSNKSLIKSIHKIFAIITSFFAFIWFILIIKSTFTYEVELRIKGSTLIVFTIAATSLFVTTVTACIAFRLEEELQVLAFVCILVSIIPTIQAVCCIIAGIICIISKIRKRAK